jgi:hypothetical protein
MSFACDRCNKTLPAKASRAGWRTRCPWCGGRVTFIGLTSESAPDRAPATLTRVRTAPRRARGKQRGSAREWLVGAGVIALLLFVLMGMGWFLVSHKRPRNDSQASAAAPAAAEVTGAKPSQGEGERETASRAVVRAETGHLPIQTDRDDQKQPEGQKPPDEPKPSIRLPEFSGAETLPIMPQPVAPEQVAPKPVAPNPVAPKPNAPKQPAVAPRPASAVFMGVKAAGKRFCIIADCSGSMAFNNRMVRLKKEMARTLKALADDQEFYVIYFSSDAIPMPAKSWRRGGKDVKKILPWIGGQPAEGSTEPMPAFELAFRLKPRPDAIYFLTDGIIPTSVPAQVARLNGMGANKVPIHTILFGGELPTVEQRTEMVPVRSGRRIIMVPRKRPVAKVEKDEGQLRQIARDSGGTYRFIADASVKVR